MNENEFLQRMESMKTDRYIAKCICTTFFGMAVVIALACVIYGVLT